MEPFLSTVPILFSYIMGLLLTKLIASVMMLYLNDAFLIQGYLMCPINVDKLLSHQCGCLKWYFELID